MKKIEECDKGGWTWYPPSCFKSKPIDWQLSANYLGQRGLYPHDSFSRLSARVVSSSGVLIRRHVRFVSELGSRYTSYNTFHAGQESFGYAQNGK